MFLIDAQQCASTCFCFVRNGLIEAVDKPVYYYYYYYTLIYTRPYAQVFGGRSVCSCMLVHRCVLVHV